MRLIGTLTFTLTILIPVVVAQGLPPSSYIPPAQNFTQKLNHGSNDNVTFEQLYQLDTSSFKPDGPILFHQGEEGPMKPIAAHVFSDYSPKLGGIVATLEHRFFGSSYPEGTSWENTTTVQYGPLTLENVLQDSVAFVTWIKKTVPGAESSKVIISGGSYGGFLTIQARMRHPDIFDGGLALSPALTSFGASINVRDNPFKFAIQDWTANVFWDANAEAALKIRTALDSLWACIEASNCPGAFPDLYLCTSPANDTEWVQLLHSVIINQYRSMTQYNLGFEETYPPNPLNIIINATLEANTTAQVLRVPIDIYNKVTSNETAATCVDWIPLTPANQIKNFHTGTSWVYISCAWFVQGGVTISPENSLFPPFGANESVTGCGNVAEWAGPSYNKTNAEWLEEFNLTEESLNKVTRLLITQGSYDNTAAIGMPHLTASSNRNHSRVILVTGMAHRENQSPEAVLPRGVKPSVDQIRDTQLSYLRDWLGIYGDDAVSNINDNHSSTLPLAASERSL